MYIKMISKRIILFCLFLYPLQSVAVEKIRVIGLFTDKAIVEIDGKQHVLSAGNTSPEGVKLVSANSREAVLEVDGKQDTYTLGTHIASNYSGPPDTASVTIAPNASGMYEVNGSINGFQVEFVVDTGATLISMNRHVAKRLGIDYKRRGLPGQSETASGYSDIYLVNLDEVRVGQIKLHDVTASVHDGEFPKVILLGNSFLNQVDMTRDGRVLVLEK